MLSYVFMRVELFVSEMPPISVLCPIEELLDKFRRHTELTFVPVVNEFSEPIGIIRETSLRVFTHARFGRELIQKRKTGEFLSMCPVVSINAEFHDLILTPTFNSRKEGFIVIKDGKYAGFLHTLTLLELYEKHRLETQRQLLQTQKMESIGALAGGIAHDFNNILASISGHLTLISMRLKMDTDDRVRHYISTIEELCCKASNLTQQLLGFARGGKYKIEPLNINEVIKHVVSILSATFPKDISFQYDLCPILPVIEADRGQLEQVLMNLFINGRDAMKSGGIINIKSVIPEENSMSNISGFGDAGLLRSDMIEVSVSDTGCGIPESIQKKIFEPFFTTKEVGKGTGMGLAMVYGIIKNHGGNIFVESIENKGSTFRIFLPRKKTQTGCNKIDSTRIESSSAGNIGVMVLDDDVNLIQVLEMYLIEMNFAVKPFTRGSDALSFYMKNSDCIDIVLLDMIMPEMSGQQVYMKLKEINPEVTTIFMSGYNSSETMQSLLSETDSEFLQKPFSLEQLKKSISNSLAAA